jgi:cobalt/nickel transport system permease protein
MAGLTSGGTALGYTPSGMLTGFSLEAIFPDYTIAGIPDAAAYILSAVIGVALVVILFRLIAASMKPKTVYSK